MSTVNDCMTCGAHSAPGARVCSACLTGVDMDAAAAITPGGALYLATRPGVPYARVGDLMTDLAAENGVQPFHLAGAAPAAQPFAWLADEVAMLRTLVTEGVRALYAARHARDREAEQRAHAQAAANHGAEFRAGF